MVETPILTYSRLTALTLLALPCATWANDAPIAKPATRDATGGVITGVTFDAIIELKAPALRTHVVLFTRYWVTPTTYRMECLWQEPHWTSTNFVYYPVSLMLRDGPGAFAITHGLHGKKWEYPKPVGPRGKFRYRNNIYEIGQLRFAANEALAGRIRTADIPASPTREDVGLTTAGATGIPTATRRFRTQWDGNRVQRLDITGEAPGGSRSIAYDYTPGGTLRKLTAELRPYRIPVSSPDVKVTVGGVTKTLRATAVTHHQGGRRCEVLYRTVVMGDKTVALPAKVSVYHGESGKLLRRATFANYRPLTAEAIARLPRERPTPDAMFVADEQVWYKCLQAAWRARDNNRLSLLDPSNAPALQDAARTIHDRFRSAKSTVARLRLANMLCQASLIQQDMENMKRWYGVYCALHHDLDLDELVLTNGKHAALVAGLWRQYEAGNAFLLATAKHAAGHVPPETVIEFAEAEIAADHFWTAYRILAELRGHPTSPPALQCRVKILIARSLTGLVKQIAVTPEAGLHLGIQKALATHELTNRQVCVLAKNAIQNATDTVKAGPAGPTTQSRVRTLKAWALEVEQAYNGCPASRPADRSGE